MPNLKIDEDTEIVTFSEEEISLLNEYFKGTNAETAYLLGKWTGKSERETCFFPVK